MIDKLLYRNRLDALFRDGWRELLRPLWSGVRRLSCRIFDTQLRELSGPLPGDTEQRSDSVTDLPAADIPTQSTDKEILIIHKKYVDGQGRPTADTSEKAIQGAEKGSIFTPETEPPTGENKKLKAPRDVPSQENPPVTQEKAGTREKDSQWDHLNDPYANRVFDPESDPEDEYAEQIRVKPQPLSSQITQEVSDLLNSIDTESDEPFDVENENDSEI